jgi:glycosyltransferase involved in cell wall biosynthesis
MQVVQVNCLRDHLRRSPADLLDAWPTLANVAGAARSAGADVTVVLSSHRDATCEREGVTFRFVSERYWMRGPSPVCVPTRLPEVVNVLKPDVIHMNGFGFPLYARALCNQHVPVLAQHHGDNPYGRLRALKRWGLAKIAAAAFTSHEQALAFVADRYFKRGRPIFEIPESSTRFQSGNLAAARRATGVHGSPVVLWVGHLNANKDPLTILEAFSQALRILPDAEFWCCYGDIHLLDRIRARLAGDRLLAAHVHLLGFVDHNTIEQLCRAADFFMLGSREESCGYAVLEALACGATPIVSDIAAFRAITGKGAVGALCKPGNADSFSSALIRLASQPIADQRAKAIAHFHKELSFAGVGRKLVDAYEAIITGHTKTLGKPR